jgi:hypothetical protein
MRLRNLIYYQLGLICLAGKLFCQEPAFAYFSKTRTIFEVTDSLVLEAGSDCAGNSYSPYFLDSIFYFKSIHTGEIYYYNYKGFLQGKLQLNFRNISIGQAQDLPVLSGNCACAKYRYPSCKSLSDIMIQKNYILAYSDHF